MRQWTLEILEKLAAIRHQIQDLAAQRSDTLNREAGIPFRIGHHVASELTNYGREHGILPKDLTFEEVDRVFRQATGEPIRSLRPGA